nr:hypothetical protein [Tanacetum cinerariifolium]
MPFSRQRMFLRYTCSSSGKGKGKGLIGNKKPDADVHKEMKNDAVKKKDVVPRKKRSITVANNMPNLEEAVKLAESISLTKAEHQEEERRLHETHTATRASKKDYRIQQHPKGSSKGSGVILEVPDEPRDDFEIVDKEIVDNEIVDEEMADEQKAKDDRDEDTDQAMNDQAGTEQARGAKAKSHVPELTVPNPSSSFTLSSTEYGNQFINANPNVSITNILKDTTKIKIQSMVDVSIYQEDPVVQRTPLINNVISMVTEKLPPTPPPTTTEAQVTNVSESDSSSMVLQRISKLENKFEMLPKIDHAEAIEESVQANIINEARINYRSYYQKLCLILSSQEWKEQSMKCSKRIQLIFSILPPHLEEKKTKGSEPSKDKDTTGSSKKDDAAPKKDNFIWFKQDTVVRPKTPYPNWHKESNADNAPEHNCFSESVNAEKDPVTFDDLMGSTIDFTKFSKNRLKKDRIPKLDLHGPTFMSLKETCKNNIELDKPLPLQGPPCHLTIHVDYFFNNDLEYLKIGNKERKYVISLTKTKTARYELEGIEEMIPRLRSSIKEYYDKNATLESITGDPNARSRNVTTSRHKVYAWMKILSVIKISVDKQYGYGYLKEIVVRRGDHDEYAFTEADFSRLHLNDINDMFLLYVQHKLHNLIGDQMVDLVNDLRTFTRSIVVKKRVKDV